MKAIIAEKQIAAERIASILCKGKPERQNEKKITVFSIDDNTIVIPLRGHVLNVDYEKKYNDWRTTNLHSLVDAPVKYLTSQPGITSVLKKHAQDIDELIISTDFDTEGESIGREAVTVVKTKNPDVKVTRARFSAITPEDIEKAFKELTSLDYNLADAADSRREIDLIWGAVLTRFVSLSSGRLGHRFLSVGRVQTPTLALIVNMEKKRLAFQPKTYWVLSAVFHKQIDFEGVHQKDKFWEKPDQAFEKIKNEKKGLVEKVSKSSKTLRPPIPFNTTGFLRAAASLGVSPSKAMSVAESLYMKGFISYPRTDNTVYPGSINLKQTVKLFESHEVFGQKAKKLLSQKKITPTRGKKKAQDHPPITPTQSVQKNRLNALQWKIYSLVVQRFFATLAPPCRIDVVKAIIDVKQEKFKCNGQTIKSLGWKEFYPYSSVKESRLPELEEGEWVEVKKFNLEEKQTQPPAQYTPSSLIKEMEKLGLGTKSTRPEIISKLQYRQYIRGSKSYQPTKIAFALIDTLEKHASQITKSEMTSKLEKQMDKVKNGDKKKEEVVTDSREMLSQVLEKLSNNYEKIGSSIRKAALATETLGKCECGGELRIIHSRKTGKRFVGCTGYSKGCRVSYPLPQRGSIVPTGKTCPKCGSPVIKVKYRRPFEMCLDPKCETKKDWGKKKSGKK
jgi:DNA topoisomerase-1